MQAGSTRQTDDDRNWEHRLFPMLLAAFGIAAGATLASTLPLQAPVPAAPAGALDVTTAAAPAPVPVVVPSRPVAAARDALVAMQVAEVLVGEGGTTSVVLLMDQQSDVVLPLFLGATEGEAVRRGLGGEAQLPPATHVLLGRMIEALGAKVERVQVDGPGADALGQVVLRRGDEEFVLEARPSDAVALAVATGSPVYAAKKVLAAQGIHRGDLRRVPGAIPTNLKVPERL